MRRRLWVLASACAVGVLVGLSARSGEAVEKTFSGSAQLDYLVVPTRPEARDITFDGFTTELSLKASVDINDHLSFGVKTCYGCHGFEMGMAYMDVRVNDALVIRAGRFTPSFGDFPERHDPANHRTSDKPLPYDMGRMLRLTEWNNSILPAPYVDNGLELRGTVALGDRVDFDYAAYVIGGLRGSSGATDVDFIASRSPALYYVDNNSQPSVGGRMAIASRLADLGALTVGASALWGRYDTDGVLDVLVLGGDLVLKIEQWVLRMEYLVRRTQMALPADPSTAFRYGPDADGHYDDYSLKEGWYLETEYPVAPGLDLVGRFDGMRRRGNVAASSELRSDSLLLRYSLGLAWSPMAWLRVKSSVEAYDFSDFSDELTVHLGLVGAF
jgi:hypothetical protein